jgi:hypothetical protein
VRPEIARGFTDADFAAARDWYSTLVNPEDEDD